MRMAREFRRPDWRRMLSELSSSEFSDWFTFYREHYFSDLLLDAEFATLKFTMVSLVGGHSGVSPRDFCLLSPESQDVDDKTDDELMAIGEGILGGRRYGC